MTRTLRHFLRCTKATAAVEAAIFSPLFLVFTLGVTDLGSGMFTMMTVNAAAQSGAAYAVINSSSTCSAMGAGCLAGIEKAMDDATGNSKFCTTAVCSAVFTACADPNGGICFTVSANYPYTPILPGAVYAWAQSTNYKSSVIVRIQ
jgi:hypothetical protein